jgi:hypothetical protein
MEKVKLSELFEIRKMLIKADYDTTKIDEAIDVAINEETSATGGPSGAVGGSSFGGGGVALSNASIAGMGQVVNAQPSSYSGVTTEPGYSDGGGTVGSGDINVPYNTGGKKVHHKVAADKYKDIHGSKSRRKDKLTASMKKLKTSQEFTSKPAKVMKFDDYTKDNLMKITRVKQ